MFSQIDYYWLLANMLGFPKRDTLKRYLSRLSIYTTITITLCEEFLV